MRTIILILATGAALSACAIQNSPAAEKKAASEAVRLEVALAGRVAGKPQSCLPPRDTNGPESFGETTLLFHSGNVIYRTETSGSCGRAGRDDILVTQIYGSSLCRGDISHTVDRTSQFPSGSCAMGDFVPYRKPSTKG